MQIDEKKNLTNNFKSSNQPKEQFLKDSNT